MLFNVMCYHVLSNYIELWISKEDDIPLMIFNVMCYHVLSNYVELWISKEDDIPLMIIYKGKTKIKVVISSYMSLFHRI